MCVLLFFNLFCFSGALYIKVWASIIQNIHLFEHFYKPENREQSGQGSTVFVYVLLRATFRM